MKIRQFILGAVLFGAIGCSENPNLYKDSNQPVDKRVENLLGQMTLEEKVAQMCQYVGIKHMQNSEKHLSLEELEKNHAHGFYKDLHSSQLIKMIEDGMRHASTIPQFCSMAVKSIFIIWETAETENGGCTEIINASDVQWHLIRKECGREQISL